MRVLVFLIAPLFAALAATAQIEDNSLDELLREMEKLANQTANPRTQDPSDQARLAAIFQSTAKRPWSEFEDAIKQAQPLGFVQFLSLSSVIAYSPHAERAFAHFSNSPVERLSLLVVASYLEGQAFHNGRFTAKATARAESLTRSKSPEIAAFATITWSVGLVTLQKPVDPVLARAAEVIAAFEKKRLSAAEEQLLEMLRGMIQAHQNTEQTDGADQPATAPESKPEGEDKPKPESEGRPQ